LVRIAGLRWTLEACFEEAKGELGLDHYEVRSDGTATSPWRCSPMPISPSSATGGRGQRSARRGSAGAHRPRSAAPPPASGGGAPAPSPQILAWSMWRRRHQQRAKLCHWRRRTQAHESRL
jgi:hypothetical protein